MNIKEINYSKVFNLGDYENEKIGVVLTVDQDEKPEDAILKAKQLVEISSKSGQDQLRKAKNVLSDPDNYTGYQVDNAKRLVETYENLTNGALKAALIEN